MDDETKFGGHGTHVAGILGAVGDNGIGVTGVNWNTTILPVKWLNGAGSAPRPSASTPSNGWCGQAGRGQRPGRQRVATFFVGTAYSQALSDEIDVLGQNDILFVTPPGTRLTTTTTRPPPLPCGYNRATKLRHGLRPERKPTCANYGDTTVDLAAPGTNVYSKLRGGTYGYLSRGLAGLRVADNFFFLGM